MVASIYLDNMGALSEVMWGRASTLHWQQLQVLHRLAPSLKFIQSHINPAHPLNHACDGRGPWQVVLEAIAGEQVFDETVRLPPLGAVGDRDKSGRAWLGDVCTWPMCCRMPYT